MQINPSKGFDCRLLLALLEMVLLKHAMHTLRTLEEQVPLSFSLALCMQTPLFMLLKDTCRTLQRSFEYICFNSFYLHQTYVYAEQALHKNESIDNIYRRLSY